MKKQTAVLLVNMGTPRSEEETKSFLLAMFKDRAILPLPALLRLLLGRLISLLRYRVSWKRYQLVGGSPLIEDTEKTAEALAGMAGMEVFTAYSYVQPTIEERMKALKKKGIDCLYILNMYPQESMATTESIKADVLRAQKQCQFNQLFFAPSYALSPSYMAYLNDVVREHLSALPVKRPLLLCVAHSIPLRQVKKGDDYPIVVEKVCAMLAGSLGLEYRIAYQSKIGPMKWLEPHVEDYMERLIAEGYGEIVILPVSFTTECLETKYDLDLRLLTRYQDHSQVTHLSRIAIPKAHPLFIQTLWDSLKRI